MKNHFFKKAIALVLTFVMLASLAVPVAYAEEPSTQTQTESANQSTRLWDVPEGVEVYFADKLTARPTIDGAITSEDGYGAAIVPGNVNMTNTNANVIASAENARASSFNYYFSYDDENIYLAFEEEGALWDTETDEDTIAGNNFDEFLFRNNYRFRFGFDLDDVNQMLQFGGGSTTSTSPTSGPGWRVLFYSNGDKTGNVKANDGDKVMEFVTEFKMSKHYVPDTNKDTKVYTDVTGDFTTKTGNPNSFAPYTAVVEMTLSKDKLLEFTNKYCGTDYASLPDAMYFSMVTTAYSWKDTEYVDASILTNGHNQFFATDIREKQADYADYGATSERQYFPGVIMFTEDETATQVLRPLENVYKLDMWKAPAGAQVINADKLTTKPTVDGVLAENEYGTLAEPNVLGSTNWMHNAIKDEKGDHESDFDYYFSYDDENIYVAYKEVGAKWYEGDTYNNAEHYDKYFARNNMTFRIGINLDDVNEFFEFGGYDPSSATGWQNLFYSKDSKVGAANSAGGVSVGSTVFKNIVKELKVVKTTAGGTVYNGGYNANGNASSGDGAYVLVCEMKINKNELLKYANQYLETDYAEFPDAMYFQAGTRPLLWTSADHAYAWGEDMNYMYFATDIREKQADYAAYGATDERQYFPGVVMFTDDDVIERPIKDSGREITAENGQKTFVAGDSAQINAKSTDTNYPFVLDGQISENEGYVKVTNGLKATSYTTGRLSGKSSGTAANPSGVSHKVPTLEYYVAETQDKIHLVIKETHIAWGNSATEYVLRNNYSLRFGFNPNDYSQAFVLTHGVNNEVNFRHADGTNASNLVSCNMGSDNWDAHKAKQTTASSGTMNWYLQKYTVNGNGEETKAPNKFNENFSSNTSWAAYFEIEFNKAKIVEYYKNNFNVELSSENFSDVMYLAPSLQVYPGSGSTIAYPLYGVIVGGKVVPHAIVLGSEKEAAGCTFTEKNTDSKYLAYEANCLSPARYYYSCAHCGNAGVSIFKSGEKLAHSYTYEFDGADRQVEGSVKTCYSGKNYYYSCSNGCFRFKAEENNIYESYDKAAHTWSVPFVVADDHTKHHSECTVCKEQNITKYNASSDHVYTAIVDEAVKVPGHTVATCVKPVEYYYSCECGEIGTFIDEDGNSLKTFFGEVDTKNHTFSKAYTSNSTAPDYHWQECTGCGATQGFAAHRYSDESDTTCQVCNRMRSLSAIGGGGGAVVTPPADTTPADTTPADTTPAVTTPADTTPVDTTPVVTTPVDTAAPETTAPVVTDAEPETTAPAETAEDTAAVTEPAEGGCGATVGFVGFAIVAALGTCAAFTSRKRED